MRLGQQSIEADVALIQTLLNLDSIGSSVSPSYGDLSTLAGAGLSYGSGALSVGAGDTSITINADSVQVRLATASGLEVSTGLKIDLADTSLALAAGGVSVNLAATSGLQVSSGLMIADTVAGAGLTIASKVLAVGAGTMITVNADDVQVAAGANYQFIGTGGGTAPGWRNVSELAGAGLTAATGILAVGAGAGLTVNADDVALTTPGTLTVSSTNVATGSHTHAITTSANPGAAAAILASTSAGGLTLVSLSFGADVTLNRYGADELGFAADDGFRVADFALDSDGYRVTGAGHGFFKYLYATEFHAKAFIADLEQALAGGQLITKSVAPLAADFTAPAASGTANLTVQEFQGFGSFHVFVDGDFVRIRKFSRSGSSLTIGDCWGTVVYASRDATNQTQTYTFTRSAAPNAGSITATTVIPKGSLALDYGTTGNGFIESVAQSGAMASGVPYTQIVTWATHPNSGQTVRTRIGNLNGVYGIAADYYGIGLGDYAGGNYLRYETNGGFVLVAGAGAITIDTNGIAIAKGTSSNNAIRWLSGATGVAQIIADLDAGTGDVSAEFTATQSVTSTSCLLGFQASNAGAGGVYARIEAGVNASNVPYITLTSTTTTVSGDLAVNGGDLTSTATTFNLLNATVTTLNLGGAATAVNLGAASCVVNGAGGLTINGGIAANDDLTLQGTSHATRTTSYVLIQPSGGFVGITVTPWMRTVVEGAASTISLTHRANDGIFSVSGAGGFGELVFGFNSSAPYNAFLQTRHASDDTTTYDIYLNTLGGNVVVGSGTAGNVSAGSFTDRTPYPSSLALAYEALGSVRGKTGKLDHISLHPFIKSVRGKEVGRDLSATVSMLTAIVQDQKARIEELERRLAA